MSGYITASSVKIIFALFPSDAVAKDAEIVNVSIPNSFPPSLAPVIPSTRPSKLQQLADVFHTAHRSAVANPFPRLHTPSDAVSGQENSLQVGGAKWKIFRQAVLDMAASTGTIPLFSPLIHQRTEAQCPVRGFLPSGFTHTQRWLLLRPTPESPAVEPRSNVPVPSY